MNKDIRIFTNQYSHNLAFPLFVGAAFGFGWTPCIGPMQGVQPKPKAAPTTNGNAKLLLYSSVKILISLFIKLKLMIPVS